MNARPGNRAEVVRARALIEQCGYWRRREELEDAEQAVQTWPAVLNPVG